MSDFKVEVVEIDEIMPHPNADRLELARVKGWVMVVGKGEYVSGGLAVFFPIDAVLPPELEAKLFTESKIKLKAGRVKTEKIRGVISQGLLAPVHKCLPHSVAVTTHYDYAEHLGVKKYEPAASSVPSIMNGKQAKKRDLNPHFHEYHDIPRIKNVPYLFAEGEHVTITEKIHGTNFRAGWVPFVPQTLWQKAKAWLPWLLGQNPSQVFVYGSRRVQLQETSYDGFDANIYAEIVRKYDLKEVIPHGMVVYGEIYGVGIQKGYTYGAEERNLVLFDIEVGGEYVSHRHFTGLAQGLGLPTSPTLYDGPWSSVLAVRLASGPSVLCKDQAVIEGVVVKTDSPRKVAKVINEEYDLLQSKTDGTDFH